ncbi:MAG: hypothetical protein KDK35_17680 [Leptospiraceae bacterium]|nr:hypothetical protein [Leptospiraceae bacterium]MCP5483959.1 hypothetical protein [Spirochaetales bacterium]
MQSFPQKLGTLMRSDGFRRAVVLFGGRAFNPLVSLVYGILAGKLLVVEDYGIYGKALSFIFVVQAITEVGLQQSLVRFLAHAIGASDENRIRAILRASLQLKLYGLAAASAIFLLLIGLIAGAPALGGLGLKIDLLRLAHPDLIHLAWLVFLGGVGLSLLTYLDSVLVSHQSYFRLAIWLPSVGMIRLLMLAWFFYTNEGLRVDHVLFAFALGPFLSVLLFFLVFPADFFLARAGRSEWKPWIRRLFGFNLWIMVASFLAILSDWMEVFIIHRTADTGLFNAARLPMQGFLILLTTMNSFLLPRLAGLEGPSQYRNFFLRIYQVLIPAVVLFLPGFFIFPWFLLWWFGPEYAPSVTVFYILYPNFILRLYFAPLGTALFALDQPLLIAIEAGLRMSTGLVLNLILYNMAGIEGAAWASLLAQATGWIFLLYCYGRYFRTGNFPLDRVGWYGRDAD